MASFSRKSQSVENELTGELYSLQAIDSVQPERGRIEEITSICNEPEIYRWLYRDMFDGSPYPPESAYEWIEWGAEGWETGTHFVFVVLDRKGGIAAACDIKSPNLDIAEIGYWASVKHRGIMTNAVAAMLEMAEEAGFQELCAKVLSNNVRSQAVLHRLGFQLSEDQAGNRDKLIYRRRLKE